MSDQHHAAGPGPAGRRPASMVRTTVFAAALAATMLLCGGCRTGDAGRSGRILAEQRPQEIYIVRPGEPDGPAGQLAARELAAALGRLYRGRVVAVGDGTDRSGAGQVIYLGTPRSLAGRKGIQAVAGRLAGPESYVVTTIQDQGRTAGLILGADRRGLLYGVYGLLRRLGYGYTLDGDLVPDPTGRPFDWSAWDLADRPLVPRRFVFNWHNFLSGCSSWNLEHWQQWTTQAQKMGYNAIMVHAYGNNPMAGFSFQGLDKPVGYLSTTRLGRDWATMHVNDVRRLLGGQVFDRPVLGSTAAVAGNDRQRTEAAQRLMAGVFDHARRRDMQVIFALDMDTASANPQRLITRLPASARFKINARGFAHMLGHTGDFWLVRPDTPQGYGFYKAQLAHLLKVYPQIDTFVLWVRTQSTAMMGLKVEHLPVEWQAEYQAVVAQEPAVAKMWRSVGLFVLGKVARAHRKALAELGRSDVKLGVGSWGFHLLPAADRFMPPGVGLYPLDYEVLWKESRLESPGGPAGVAQVASHRPVYPIHWAQHDDGKYVGPPYPPFEHFYDLLARSHCHTAGYGIIHWTTRPLDLFFIGLSDAVWAGSKNQPVASTCRRLAGAMVGPRHEQVFGQYLHQWLTGLPKIGRETRDFFIDHELKGIDQVRAAHRQRMDLLGRIDPATLGEEQRRRVDYFRGLEQFVLSVYENEAHYRRALALYRDGDWPAARAELQKADVPSAIRQFADNAARLGISRGEQGLVVSLNLRWLPHYIALAQKLDAESWRINYGPTSHDPLAQSAGRFTFYAEPGGRLWQTLGEKETGCKVFQLGRGQVPVAGKDEEPALVEIAGQGVIIDRPVTLPLLAMMHSKYDRSAQKPGRSFTARPFRLTVWMLRPTDGRPASCTLKVDNDGKMVAQQSLTLAPTAPDRPAVQSVDLTFEAPPGEVRLSITPEQGVVRLCGMVGQVTGRPARVQSTGQVDAGPGS